MVKKFGDDNANLYVVALAWYGFTAIFPLLLVLVTVLGFVGAQGLGEGILNTLHEFPVIGSSFNPAQPTALHGNGVGLVIGLLGLLYGAQGVTETAQQAMDTVWGVPQDQRAGFAPRLGRSLAGLGIIGGAFLINALVTTYLTGGTTNYFIRIPVLLFLVALNTGLYFASFVVLSVGAPNPRSLLPGAIIAAIGFTVLITLGTGLMTHQLRTASATYGAFGSVIGIVAFLLL
ncbi:MAG: YihY/virulence factor BrkB family protein, partial [Acidimicrobiales bacterium]|nr:YihY/virulence factor BrkB family protein [Acidimicrobiales bacterium]